MDLLARLFQKSSSSASHEIVNAAMKLSLEWGPDYGKPIQARLMKMFPEVTQVQADELEDLCKQIKRFSFDLYLQVPAGKMTDSGVQAKIRERYPFLSREVIQRISVQGMYYAHK